MGFQVPGRCRPLSKFMEFLQDLILMASVALHSQYPLTDLTTLAFPQSILCSFLVTCTAIPLLTSLLTTAHLCSVSRTFRVLLDSPDCVHSITILHKQLYTLRMLYTHSTVIVHHRNFEALHSGPMYIIHMYVTFGQKHVI